MSAGLLSLTVLALAIAGYILGRRRAVSVAGGDARKLHSLPSYHGQSVFLFTAVPAFILMIFWLLAQPVYIENRVTALIPNIEADDAAARELAMADVRRVASGLDLAIAQGALRQADLDTLQAGATDLRGKLAGVGVALGADVSQYTFEAAREYRALKGSLGIGMAVAVLAAAAVGFAFAWSRISVAFRARNVSESFVIAMLIGASLVAVLTTFGIVFSLVFETWHFFELYPARDFFLSTTWSPKFGGGSSLGILPLLWGTLYVSVIALLVAVPIGLLSAIYLSEYASRRFRTFVKPLIEILAGIPTIVYGLFALITVGPLLRDWFAQPMGLGNSSSSVMTAGIVMGIMVIPFVSSLSDDIINAVPQSMRDGSLGLGATPSETIRKVVLPAALPGVVGAILLAASRAIGETMIVVMGAGAAARLSMNPFEAMTTVTVKIVSQLTGDTEFGSPETLVAFALGLTLFIITLGLNVVALAIVRKYREQYE
ncbi:MAG: phosphate ABC transporter permease subunit PstC [Rhodobacter sp.]|nr:phosphate ABC transporter permease subunit PstC [Rhodobacter sp.]MCA3457169.1 phosphate ABC transporter permease subunit PstC [Rhodobacter sp.]MCA3460191.1 phosphate ABC transporter permease subunit PstC [Rhodobacter sp.]MCA3463421.1 phosphate ABC transporter permease subunit PstC [Rhodobacter sp.]MCA3466666.1 phosphate ABC transporter permease subunit PstC [Rhodobacter sp.]